MNGEWPFILRRIRRDLHDFNINNENEWLVCAQHFGVNTCLLDFTYSPLVALLFAAENAFEVNQNEEELDDDSNDKWQ